MIAGWLVDFHWRLDLCDESVISIGVKEPYLVTDFWTESGGNYLALTGYLSSL